VWGSIAKVGKAQFPLGIVPAPADFFGRVIGSGNGFTKIVQSHIREQALARMLRSSPVAIFRLLLGRFPPPPSNSGVVGSESLGVIAGVASEFKTAGERDRTTDGNRFWLICTGAGVLCPG